MFFFGRIFIHFCFRFFVVSSSYVLDLSRSLVAVTVLSVSLHSVHSSLVPQPRDIYSMYIPSRIALCMYLEYCPTVFTTRFPLCNCVVLCVLPRLPVFLLVVLEGMFPLVSPLPSSSYYYSFHRHESLCKSRVVVLLRLRTVLCIVSYLTSLVAIFPVLVFLCSFSTT